MHGPPSWRRARRARSCSASRWAGPWRCRAPTPRVSRACSGWLRGCPTASGSTGCAASASTSCTGRWTAGFRESPACARRARARASSGRAGWASRAATGSSRVPCTASRCAPRSASSRSPGRALGRPRRGAHRDVGCDVTARADDVSTRVGTVRPRTSRISQVVTLIAVVVPPLGIACAAGLLWGVAFHWVDVAILVGFYVVCAFGTTIGFHRYFTHKGFEARTPVKGALAVLGCMTMQGPLIQWVTDHRKHHALSDQAGRPALAARRSWRGRPGAPSRASSTRTSAGSSRTSAWRRAASTARTSTRTVCSSGSTASTCSGWC